MKECYQASFLVTLSVTHGWRFISEYFRDDYRGEKSTALSAYQFMAAGSILYGIAIILLMPIKTAPAADIQAGLTALWHPGAILFLQSLGVGSFVFSGKSKVTAALISFQIIKERT